ncbi:MAG: cell division/cell wall cluster transcriptional repressor MraZ [Fusobacteriia bacterium 4572_132]|nr:MAG: cell division/cell wall cluster transcriptional repressor MraZ [Fusobacteriia bacterium 4572_132]
MFMGEYNHKVDNKNRIMLPSKFREQFENQEFVLTRGLDNCIFMYPIEEWKLLEEKIKELPLTKKDARAFVRFLFSGALNDILDKQGRIKLSENLKVYAKIEKDVVITGALNRIEIWSKENWDIYMKKAENSFEDIAENLINL